MLYEYEFLDKVWSDNPEYVREFYDNIKKYEELCKEIELIISKTIDEESIEIASISSRG